MAIKIFVTKEDYLKGREIKDPLSATQIAHMENLIDTVNVLLNEEGCPGYFGVSSGYRPASINTEAGGALKSAHLTCQAIDLRDPAGVIDKWLFNNQELLIQYGLYLEEPSKTPGWSHLQTRSTKSGRRVFLP